MVRVLVWDYGNVNAEVRLGEEGRVPAVFKWACCAFKIQVPESVINSSLIHWGELAVIFRPHRNKQVAGRLGWEENFWNAEICSCAYSPPSWIWDDSSPQWRRNINLRKCENLGRAAVNRTVRVGHSVCTLVLIPVNMIFNPSQPWAPLHVGCAMMMDIFSGTDKGKFVPFNWKC